MGVKHLDFNADYREFFEPNDPQRMMFDEIQDVFGSSDNIMFLLVPATQDVFTEEVFTVIHHVTERAWQIPHSYRVDSLTNYQYSWSVGDDLMVEDLLPDVDSLSIDRLAWAKKAALSEPGLIGRLLNKAGSVTSVNVLVNVRGKPSSAEHSAVQFAYALRDELRREYPQLDVYLLGEVMANATFNDLYVQDTTTLLPLMVLLILLLAMWALKSVLASIHILIVVIVSVSASLGLIGWLGGALTSPSSAAPIIIVTLAIADCVHLLTHYLRFRQEGTTNEEAITKSLGRNAKAIFYTSLTTMIGFLSLNASDSPPFRDLGNFVALGVMMAFLFSVLLLPLLLVFFSCSPRGKLLRFTWKAWIDKCHKYARSIVVLTVMILLGSVYGLNKNDFNDDWIAYFDESVAFRQAVDISEQHLSGTTTLEYVLTSHAGITDPAFLHDADAFAQYLYSLPQTRHVFTFTDVLKRLNRNMNGDDPAYYLLPHNRELAAQYLLLYEMSLPFGLDVTNQINLDKTAMRIMVTFQNLSSTQLIRLENEIAEHLQHVDAFDFFVTSPSSMFAHLSHNNIRSMLLGTVVAMLVIAIVLMFALKSVKLGALSVIPNILPVFVAFGVWGIWVSEINLGLSIVASITMGIVVDDTVYFLTHYQYARQACNCNRVDALVRTLEESGPAIVLTTFILMMGFLVLASSDFIINANLGLLTAITLALALVGDLLVLPAILLIQEKRTTNASALAT